MTLRKHILANYIGAGVVALAPIIALPWYLEALGPEKFGLIGFIIMLQAVLGLLDAGMGQALVREFALRHETAGTGGFHTASLLFGFECIYWLFALGAGCITLLLADFIASQWLILNNLPAVSGKDAVVGAAFIFAAQFPGSIYRSLLIGSQMQVALNGIMIGGALLRHGGGVLAIIALPSLTTYLVWHASTALLETLVRGWCAWRTLNVVRGQVKWEAGALRPVWKSVAGMSGAVWLGALTVQIDRIVLSKMVGIDQFGYYTIAATIATGVLQLIYPLVQAVLPQTVRLRNDSAALRMLSVKLARLIGMLVISAALVFITGGEWLLGVWLRNAAATAIVYPILAILLVGTAMNAFYNVGYINWIAHEKIFRVFQVNALALSLSATLIPMLVAWKGIGGAAFGWLAINLIGCILSLEWLKRN